jgi:hypothetical protein
MWGCVVNAKPLAVNPRIDGTVSFDGPHGRSGPCGEEKITYPHRGRIPNRPEVIERIQRSVVFVRKCKWELSVRNTINCVLIEE